jgi:hypothetical protein
VSGNIILVAGALLLDRRSCHPGGGTLIEVCTIIVAGRSQGTVIDIPEPGPYLAFLLEASQPASVCTISLDAVSE